MRLRNVFASVAVLIGAMAPVWAGAPKLAVENPEFDFGRRENHEPVDVTFVLQNLGDEMLEITSIRPTCGCTVPDTKSMSLKPGESEVLKATVSLPKHLGPVHKAINITTNDPDAAHYELKISGTLLQYIYPDPQSIVLQKVSGSDVVEATSIIQSMDPEATFGITGLKVLHSNTDKPSEFFTAAYKPGTEPNTYELTVKTIPPLPEQLLVGRVLIETDSDRMPELEVTITATVVGPVRVTPKSIMLPQPRDGMKPLTRNILVQKGIVDEMSVTGATSDADGVEITVQDKGELGFMVQVSNIPVISDIDGKVVIIKTDVPGAEEIRIPFQIIEPRQVQRQPGR